MSEDPGRRPRVIDDGAAPPPAVAAPAAVEPATGPRVIDAASGPAQRLDFGPPALLDGAAGPPAGPASLMPALGGLAVLAIGTLLVALADRVLDQFDRSPTLGAAGLAVLLAGASLFGLAAWRELRGYLQIRRLDRDRALFRRDTGDPEPARRAALSWLARLRGGRLDVAAAEAAVTRSESVAELLRALEQMPLERLDRRAEAAVTAAAMQTAGMVALSPASAADALLATWRSLRLMREIAGIYGFRPGWLGTAMLLRRVAINAALVIGVDQGAEWLAGSLVSSPLLARVIGDAAGAGAAGQRVYRLGRITITVCRIVPRDR